MPLALGASPAFVPVRVQAPAEDPLVITPPEPDTGTVGSAYTWSFEATGGLPPRTWSIDVLPAGLSLNADTGNVSGTPTEEGVVDAVVEVEDADGTVVTADARFEIAPATPIALDFGPPTISTGVQGAAYSFTFTPVPGSGSGAGYTFDIISGSVPGLTLATNGVYSGTPTTLTGGTPNEITVRLRDSALNSTQRDYAMDVVEAVNDREYFELWAKSPYLHAGAQTGIAHDALEADGVTPRAAPSAPGTNWFCYWLGSPKSVASIVAWLESVKTNASKPTNYTYTGTTTPQTAYCQFDENTVGPASDAGLEVQCGHDDPGNGNLVFVWDETFEDDMIEAGEADPGLDAVPVVAQYKWHQQAMSPSSTGRFLENRININARNKNSETSESSPRRAARLDLRIYDDLQARVTGPIFPQYMTSANVNPTGKYGENNPPSVPVYENLKGRHIFQVRMGLSGSAFGSFSESAGEGSGGIVENQHACTITTGGAGGVVATVTFTSVSWDAGNPTWAAGQTVTIKGCTGVNAAAFNGPRTIASVIAAGRNSFTFTLDSDLSGASAEGSPTVGTDYDEISWFYGNLKDGWRCIVWKIPVYHQQNGVRAWWRQHDTSTAKKELPVFELTRSGTTATVTITKGGPVSVISMVRNTTPEAGWADPPPGPGGGQPEAWKNGKYAVLCTIDPSAPAHGMKASPTGNRWVVLKGANEADYRGGFNADYFKTDTGRGIHTDHQFTIYVTASSGQPSGTFLYATQEDGIEALDSIRIADPSLVSDFDGDYQVTGASRLNPSDSVTGGPNAGPANNVMTFTCAGTETTPSVVTGVLVRHAFLRPFKVFIGPTLFCLKDYDSAGMGVGEGIKDPVEAAALGTPADYDQGLFVLPAATWP